MKRAAALATVASVFALPSLALADRASEKRAFAAQCDESISIARLAGAPYKFKGKKVDLHGTVGAAMSDANGFNLQDGDGSDIGVIGDARNLETGQTVRVLGIVLDPQSGGTQEGGSATFAIVQSHFVA